MKVICYRDLLVWSKAIDLVECVYALTRNCPQSEMFGLVSQMRRAVVSIPANIAEGAACGHKKDFLQYISIAYGSLAELETHLEIANRLSYLERESAGHIWQGISECGRMLNGLRRSLEKSIS